MHVTTKSRAAGRWFAAHTKPRKEAVAEEHLRRQSYTVYYPRLFETKRRNGSWRQVIEPLFLRYLFVQLTEGQYPRCCALQGQGGSAHKYD